MKNYIVALATSGSTTCTTNESTYRANNTCNLLPATSLGNWAQTWRVWRPPAPSPSVLLWTSPVWTVCLTWKILQRDRPVLSPPFTTLWLIWLPLSRVSFLLSLLFVVSNLSSLFLCRRREGIGNKGATEPTDGIAIPAGSPVQATVAAQREAQKIAEGSVAIEGQWEEDGKQGVPVVAGTQLVHHYGFQHRFRYWFDGRYRIGNCGWI